MATTTNRERWHARPLGVFHLRQLQSYLILWSQLSLGGIETTFLGTKATILLFAASSKDGCGCVFPVASAHTEGYAEILESNVAGVTEYGGTQDD